MSITNFTPAPWLSDTEPHPGSIMVRPGALMVRARGCTVAEVIPQNRIIDRANSALIAAAPDLYAALDAFLDAYEERGEVDFSIRQRARAALNRAEGRTP